MPTPCYAADLHLCDSNFPGRVFLSEATLSVITASRFAIYEANPDADLQPVLFQVLDADQECNMVLASACNIVGNDFDLGELTGLSCVRYISAGYYSCQGGHFLGWIPCHTS